MATHRGVDMSSSEQALKLNSAKAQADAELKSDVSRLKLEDQAALELLTALAVANQLKRHEPPPAPKRKQETKPRQKSIKPLSQQDIIFDKAKLPKPTVPLNNILAPVRELFIAGGGGAGRSLPGAIIEACKFGLDLDKVEVVCATSVGTIMGLGIVLGIPAHKMSQVLDELPTDQFQDWSIATIMDFFQNWGVCEGKSMPSSFRAVIKKYSGLDDPTFEELFHKTKKEFRVIVANVSKKKMEILSHKTHPQMKVAEAVGLSCSVPFLFPPKWFPNEQGELEAFTDGGIIKNYPWGVGSDPNRPLEEQLGFIFVNRSAAYAMNNDSHEPLSRLQDYLTNLLTMAVFQDPLCLSDSVKARTIAISLGWNPLKFNATPEEQKGLDKAGKQGARRLVKQIIHLKFGIDLDEIYDSIFGGITDCQACKSQPSPASIESNKKQKNTQPVQSSQGKSPKSVSKMNPSKNSSAYERIKYVVNYMFGINLDQVYQSFVDRMLEGANCQYRLFSPLFNAKKVAPGKNTSQSSQLAEPVRLTP